MTDLVTLLALAERCEQATGPDRELDAEIAWMLTAQDRKRLGPPDLRREIWHAGLSTPAWVPFENVSSFHPNYTSSLDAAVTLVPEGWGYELRQNHSRLRRALCRMWDGRFIWPGGTVAAGPALALCAAALRARATMPQPSSDT
jgi:hypothetical protein